LKLRLKKKNDGEPVVTFVRADGSSTSGRLGSGGFGAVHDLTHYVVERSLALRSGFFGLLAQGWQMGDFNAPGAAARVPDEAIVAECVVGQLANVVLGDQPLDPAEFNWLVAGAVAAVRPGATVPVLSSETLSRVHRQLLRLLDEWRALPPGRVLELEFPPG
jgi:hypothetical protein